ncbi:MAG: sodium-dependent transporter, partial [Clostridia bacterium]|nr:sodium-dependent transporter [Clostridia bacterium]
MEKNKKNNGFVSGIGFILAAAGSAVGLGNVWAFPYKTATYGGAAFVFVYIVCILLIGCIAMIAEIYIGKRSEANAVTSYKKIRPSLGWIGLAVCIIPVFIACYYSVLGGWTLRFAVNSFQGAEVKDNVHSFTSFISSPYKPVLFTLIIFLLTSLIITGGVKNGIEKASKILMPVLFFILLSIAVYSLTLGKGVKDGLEFYLNPDFSKLGFDGVIAAMGQAFYSLSLGMGIMVAYGSYSGKEIKLGKSVFMISVFDTLVALIAGLAIFPAIGALQPDSLGNAQGVGLVFVILPQIFFKMGAVGKLVSFLFFFMIVIAAVTSIISLIETGVQFVIQKFKIKLKIATLYLTAFCALVSIPVAWSVGGAFNGAITLFGYDLLTFMDEMTNTVLMPLGAFCSCLAIGWMLDPKPTAN